MVKITREKTENSQAFLTIEMEPAEAEESLKQSYHRLVKKASVPGFRKGKHRGIYWNAIWVRKASLKMR